MLKLAASNVVVTLQQPAPFGIAEVSGASFVRARLLEAILESAELSGANFEGAHLTSAALPLAETFVL